MMPAVTPLAKDHVSVSSLTTHLKCPRQYELKYVTEVPPSHRSGSLALGSAVHAVLAFFYGRLMRAMEEPSVEELKSEFVVAWSRALEGDVPVLLDDGETVDAAQDKGLALVEVFHRDAPRPAQVTGVEQRFAVELVDTTTGEALPRRLVGIMDTVVRDADGRHRILEHKTAAKRFAEDKLRYDLQPTAYSLAALALGLGPVSVTLQILLKQKKPSLELRDLIRDDRDHDDFLHVVSGVLRAIEAEAFYPIHDWWCRSCPWAGPCVAG